MLSDSKSPQNKKKDDKSGMDPDMEKMMEEMNKMLKDFFSSNSKSSGSGGSGGGGRKGEIIVGFFQAQLANCMWIWMILKRMQIFCLDTSIEGGSKWQNTKALSKNTPCAKLLPTHIHQKARNWFLSAAFFCFSHLFFVLEPDPDQMRRQLIMGISVSFVSFL